MPNTLSYANKFLPIIDNIYKTSSYTSKLDTPQMPGWFGGVNEIKVLKVSTTGLGNYDRETGYPGGDVTAEWETMKLSQERGKKISIDRMDDEEVLGLVFGTVTGNFMREHVIPEIDAYRFAKYATGAGHKEESQDLAKETILKAFDDAVKYQDSKEVPEEGRILFVNSDLKPIVSAGIGRMLGNESSVNTIVNNYNGIPIQYVTPGRFYSQIKLNDGTSAYGFEKDSSGKSINFILMKSEAIVQGVKFALPKIFTPDENQDKDAWMFQYRNYHDVFIYDNKKDAIYSSIASA